MSENNKDFMEQLTDLDENFVEEIAENYPALDANQKKRILKHCLEKSGLPDGDIQVTENTEFSEENDEISVSGIEHYNKPIWRKYASSVATLVVAIVGIASVVILRGNLTGDDDFDISNPPVVSSVAEPNQVTKIVTGSYIDKGYNANGFDYAGQNDYSGIIIGGTTTAPPATEPGHIVEENSHHNIENDVYEPNNEQPTQPPATAPPVTAPPQTTTTTSIVIETTITTMTITEVPTTTVTSEIIETTENPTTEPAREPNKYGFYEVEKPPETSISVASLAGTWYYVDNIENVLMIYESEDIYTGNWESIFYGETKVGYIKLEYSLDENGIASYWYNFYENTGEPWPGELWRSFRVTGEIPLDYLYKDKSDTPEFSRNLNSESTNSIY